MRVLVLGYIRPELDYTSRGESYHTIINAHRYSPIWYLSEALKADIDTDIRVAIKSLERPAYSRYESDDFFDIRRNNTGACVPHPQQP